MQASGGQRGGKLQVYACPACGGAVGYDARTGALTCRWCGATYADDRRGELEVREVSPELSGYLCPTCGAQLMSDDFVAADTCPYCGNGGVAPQRFGGEFRPDYIIPFSLTKREAIDRYEQAVAEKRFLPDDFRSRAAVVSVLGAYVPFWLQDGTVDFAFTFDIDDGGGSDTIYTVAYREGSYDFRHVPADGSARMPDDMMDSIEPYDLSALEPFSTELLPGFVAERFTVTLEEVAKRIDTRAKNSALLAARTTTLDDTWRNSYANGKRSRAVVHHGGSAQALLPVWLIAVEYAGECYLVGVNGQTGSVAVNLPIDEAKQRVAARRAAAKDLLIALPIAVFAIGMGAYLMMRLEAWRDPLAMYLCVGVILAGIATAAIGCVFAYRQAQREVRESMQNVAEAIDADEYEAELHLAVSKRWQAPKQDHDNWPEL